MRWRRRRAETRDPSSFRPHPAAGLAGFCAHGVGMLDACKECEADSLPSEPVDPALAAATDLACRLAEDRDVLAKQLEEVRDVLRESGLVDSRGDVGDVAAGVRLLLASNRGAVHDVDHVSAQLAVERQLVRQLTATVARVEAERDALAAGPAWVEAKRWRRRAEQDRRNAVAMADRLAAAEGRRVHAPRTSDVDPIGGTS